MYRPKFSITPTDRIFTAGSCFAQHVGRALRKKGFDVIDTETLPERCDPELKSRFGFGLYSARYGNLYSARQFLQLLQEAFGAFTP